MRPRLISAILWTLICVNNLTLVVGGLITWLGYAIPARLQKFGLLPEVAIIAGFAALLAACLGLCALNYSSHYAMNIYGASCTVFFALLVFGLPDSLYKSKEFDTSNHVALEVVYYFLIIILAILIICSFKFAQDLRNKSLIPFNASESLPDCSCSHQNQSNPTMSTILNNNSFDLLPLNPNYSSLQQQLHNHCCNGNSPWNNSQSQGDMINLVCRGSSCQINGNCKNKSTQETNYCIDNVGKLRYPSDMYSHTVAQLNHYNGLERHSTGNCNDTQAWPIKQSTASGLNQLKQYAPLAHRGYYRVHTNLAKNVDANRNSYYSAEPTEYKQHEENGGEVSSSNDDDNNNNQDGPIRGSRMDVGNLLSAVRTSSVPRDLHKSLSNHALSGSNFNQNPSPITSFSNNSGRHNQHTCRRQHPPDCAGWLNNFRNSHQHLIQDNHCNWWADRRAYTLGRCKCNSNRDASSLMTKINVSPTITCHQTPYLAQNKQQCNSHALHLDKVSIIRSGDTTTE